MYGAWWPGVEKKSEKIRAARARKPARATHRACGRPRARGAQAAGGGAPPPQAQPGWWWCTSRTIAGWSSSGRSKRLL